MILINKIFYILQKFFKKSKKKVKKIFKKFLLNARLKNESNKVLNCSDYSNYQPVNFVSNDLIFSACQENYKPYLNPISNYQYLVESLVDIENIKIIPLFELFSLKCAGNKFIGLRHDIDGNPVKAIRLARFLAKNGICGSFYLLHTAMYYGQFYKNIFIRNPMLIDWVKQFIVAGCELGLHNDAYGVYLNHNCNGIESVKQEIEWLRSVGAIIRGTVAHNTAATYNAENYEIFKEKVLWQREVFINKKTRLPIGKVSMEELDLDYEGTFAIPKEEKLDLKEIEKFIADKKGINIRSKKWMYTYLNKNPYCNWNIDYQFWLIGKNMWIASGGSKENSLFEWKIDVTKVLQIIRDLPINSKSIIIIHPEYFDIY